MGADGRCRRIANVASEWPRVCDTSDICKPTPYLQLWKSTAQVSEIRFDYGGHVHVTNDSNEINSIRFLAETCTYFVFWLLLGYVGIATPLDDTGPINCTNGYACNCETRN